MHGILFCSENNSCPVASTYMQCEESVTMQGCLVARVMQCEESVTMQGCLVDRVNR